MIIRYLDPKGIPYMHPLEQQLSTVAAVEVSGTMPFAFYGSRVEAPCCCTCFWVTVGFRVVVVVVVGMAACRQQDCIGVRGKYCGRWEVLACPYDSNVSRGGILQHSRIPTLVQELSGPD